MNDTLHFITCGSVDDGKSTLIGRLLLESNQIFEDHLAALESDSARYGTQGDAIDLALLVDGLQAEREQSITIDVAYRFFSTSRRRFMVADCPGHEQYTRNMATGASNSDLAILVVNASKGLTTQTHRHARIVGLMGIRNLVMAVNKMDLVAWNEGAFSCIVDEFMPLVRELSFDSFRPIPVSALNGDNVAKHSLNSQWYTGSTLLEHLEQVEVSHNLLAGAFRMAVQLVNRPNPDFRGYSGRIAEGALRIGDRVRVLPGGLESSVRSILTWQKENDIASAGESVTICLEDEMDISRGSVIAAAHDPVEIADQFEVKLLCLSEELLIPGRMYLLRLHTCLAAATITRIKYKVDPKSGARLAARDLGMNEIGIVNLSLDRPVPFESYSRCRGLGGFILIDRLTNQTVGAGMIDFALRRAGNIHWQAVQVQKSARASQKLQKPGCLWLTGLPGSGKSTIANLLEKRLFAAGKHTYLLDGDNVRHGLNRDLGFTEVDRVENIRRVAEVAGLLVDAGLLVIVSLVSPYRSDRRFARSRFAPNEFIEVFVDAPLEECERRDPKGLYAKARRGELVNFTGIDSEYEPPESAEVHIDTTKHSPEECVNRILSALGEFLVERASK